VALADVNGPQTVHCGLSSWIGGQDRMGDIAGIASILLSLILLMVLAYRGISVIILAPFLAMLAVLLSGGGHQLLAIYTPKM